MPNRRPRRHPTPDGKCAECRLRRAAKWRALCQHCIYVQRTGRADVLPRYPHRCIECEARPRTKGRRMCGPCYYKVRKAMMTPQQWAARLAYLQLAKKIGGAAASQVLAKKPPGRIMPDAA